MEKHTETEVSYSISNISSYFLAIPQGSLGGPTILSLGGPTILSLGGPTILSIGGPTVMPLYVPCNEKWKSEPSKDCEDPQKYDIESPNDPWQFLLILTPDHESN